MTLKPRQRRSSALTVLILAMAAGQGAAAAAPSCSPSLVNLGTLGGTYSVAKAMDDKGNVVGYSATAQGLEHGFLHKGPGMVDLAGKMPLDLRALPSRAEAINAAGQVAGTLNERQMWRYTPATRRFQASPDPIYYYMTSVCQVNGMADDGAMVARAGSVLSAPRYRLGALAQHPEYINAQTEIDDSSGYFYPVCDTYRAAMNAQGDVAWQGVGAHGGDAYSLRYPTSITTPWGSVLHTPRFAQGEQTWPEVRLRRLNGLKQGAATAYETVSCGYRWSASGRERALVFQALAWGGEFVDLGAGLYAAQGGTSAARAVSEDGRHVAGYSTRPGAACDSPATTATLYTHVGQPGRAIRTVNVAPRGDEVKGSEAVLVNTRQQVLGWADAPKPRAFVYTRAKGARFLDALFPELSQIEDDLFQNEQGQIAGTATIGGERRAFRIDCVDGD